MSTKWQNISLVSLAKEEIGELLAKNREGTARRQLDRRHLLFGEGLQTVLNNPLSINLANKQAIEDERNIDGG